MKRTLTSLFLPPDTSLTTPVDSVSPEASREKKLKRSSEVELNQKLQDCMQALEKRDYSQLENYIESCPDLRDALSEEGYPLIWYYIRINKKAMDFEYLSKLQLGINIWDSRGFTPLHHVIFLEAEVSVQGGKLDRKLVQGLIKLGADVNLPDKNGKTALHYAAETGLSHIVGLLCKNEAKVDLTDELGNGAFHYAVINGFSNPEKSKSVIKTLRAYKANPNIQDKYGRTPLHLVLLHFTDLKNKQNRSDKQSDKEFVHINLIRALLKAGAEKNIPNAYGQLATELDEPLGLFKSAATLPEDYPIASLDFKENFITRLAPSLQSAKEWGNIPKFAIITGPNGSGKSHLLIYTRGFLERFGRNKIHFIYKDSQSLEKYASAKEENYTASPPSSSYPFYSSSYYFSLSKKEKRKISQAVKILQNPQESSDSIASDPIVTSLVEQTQLNFNSATNQASLEEIVSEQYIILQVRDILGKKDSPNKIAKVIAKQAMQDNKSSDIPKEEILKYGSRLIKKDKEPLTSSHALSELKIVFKAYIEKRKKILDKYKCISHFDVLFSTYCSTYCRDTKLLPKEELYLSFIEFTKTPNKLQELVEKIADDEVGPAPWIELNNLFYSNGLHFRLHYESTSPNYRETLYFTKEIYRVMQTITIDQPDQLSAGERLILDIFSWRYYIDKTGAISKISIILLDEPDRHFDPELSKIFINCLTHLSKAYNIQVMMTTHRPDTLAYVPEGSIFTIKRDKITNNASIEPTNRLHALFKLTPNLRDLTNFHIKVCVEAFDDVMFYEKVYNQLLRLCEQHRKAKTKLTFTLDLDTTPRQCQEILSRRFQLSFYSVVLTREGSKGGDAMVLRAVQGEKLAVEYTKQIGIKALFDPSIRYPLGLIDADAHIANGTDPQGKITTDFDEIKDQIRFTKRHTLENYLYDPVVLFSALDEQAIDDLISGEHTGLKDFAKGCHELLTRGVSSSGKNPFEAYFRYFIEELIKGDEKGEIHKDQYLEIYRYINPARQFEKEVKKFNVLKQLQIDLSVSLNREIKTTKEVIDELLKKDAKRISILSSEGVEGHIVQYPGLFIKARGHNLEEFFAGKTIFAKTIHNPKARATAFKRELIKRMITSPDIHLPADLVEVLFELNSKVRTQANTVIKP
jgi:ankyrin repeat protein/ABC-type lipoprotein export system ATPase subunit